ncbi:DUF4062 domain-containing protein [Marinimicrobium sp. ABcell2]|uniref:DUF4062 domain-containing protein n=1 Tax=Marinimicrobium sp. ABcell2 TaxID=3069751 RepID=UPI0027B7810C|nr:DUF4062 domain-containing protein [Marinimicrobium sp. ABcell2]MDQ2075168.1 DUF4062 domain-containing protein [Marinimicrobium sp. ABcell2]
MASPKVFLSSTCFDLTEVRDSLVSFCNGFGFDVVTSENGDVFYHPDLHTHESCINEVSNCQILILIIGGRFGGGYKVDPRKSITNAEYLAAKELGIPVFTFVKKGVLSDHFVFQKNKEKDFAVEIEYPSIENQKYAKNIFSFIDSVRASKVNNGLFDFQLARDIHEKLRKQWAGMFFDFLTQRSVSNQLRTTNESITNLSIASKKIEELVKNIYRQVDEVGANASILTIDTEGEASKFFSSICQATGSSYFVNSNLVDELAKTPPETWWDFLTQFEEFVYIEGATSSDNRVTDIVVHNPSNTVVADIEGDLSEAEKKERDKLAFSYKQFLKLSDKLRKELLMKYDEIPF